MNNVEFVSWIGKNAARVTHYKNGGDGSGDGGCDCIGLVIGAWRMSGNKWPWTHGTNYAARYLTRGLAADQPLRLGDLVYKAREPGEAGYDLPSTYRGHHDKRDYYHVGVVTAASPLEITHCTGVPGGIKRDTKRGKWKYSGQFSKITYSEEPMSGYTATVYAPNGGKVNLRNGPGTSYDVIARIPTGTQVETISETKTGWVFIRAGSRQGYMNAEYLRDLSLPADDPGDGASADTGAQTGTSVQAVMQARERLEAAQLSLQAAQEAVESARALLSDAG